MSWRTKLGLAGTDTLIYSDKVKAGRRLKVCGQYTDNELADMKANLEAAGETVLKAEHYTWKHLDFLTLHAAVLVIS